ncbi:phage tail protein [Paenibacillus chungangensis]|uniref:Phage tail protein n=1 Tax=Paenibacillus chungangensis TaxID=696535 RepID=A0ABW3HRW1_9BACL
MEPFVGEIQMFAGTFAPRGWAFCDGQLLAVSEYDTLFSLIGTMYGGDGITTFGLPDLRGRIPLHQGTGPGLSTYHLGAKGGVEDVTLTVNQLPPHSHSMQARGEQGNTSNPVGAVPALSTLASYSEAGSAPIGDMDGTALLGTGWGQPHNNMMPYVCVHFIIALYGIYPSRY